MKAIDALGLSYQNKAQSVLLAEFVERYDLPQNDQADFILLADEQGLSLHQQTQKKPLVYAIDIARFVKRQKTYPAPRQGAFNQALGRQTKTVIDATGGWGGDALLMCSQGMQVTLIERHPVLALMLQEAMQRLAKTQWAERHLVSIPSVFFGEASQLLPELELADCVYLDPMFPPKRKQSAATNKYMSLLHDWVGQDSDATQLWQTAVEYNKRVVVKRPDYAEPLGRKPDVQFSSKLVHYDTYLKAAS